ncbi:Prokaryotic metallothionein [Amycolatopsis sp. NPDC049868]|uniref:Prokaryotic metallothionein n=1 Tax=Amycolatopsis sp. NPDC049868 TaxID=3363934 RepID=UPI00379E961D
MVPCEVCGNDYELVFEIHTQDGAVHTFDSFECAIHRLAPLCEHCGCRVVGHGVQVEGRFFCCAHCARQTAVVGAEQARDSVGATRR